MYCGEAGVERVVEGIDKSEVCPAYLDRDREDLFSYKSRELLKKKCSVSIITDSTY